MESCTLQLPFAFKVSYPHHTHTHTHTHVWLDKYDASICLCAFIKPPRSHESLSKAHLPQRRCQTAHREGWSSPSLPGKLIPKRDVIGRRACHVTASTIRFRGAEDSGSFSHTLSHTHSRQRESGGWRLSNRLFSALKCVPGQSWRLLVMEVSEALVTLSAVLKLQSGKQNRCLMRIVPPRRCSSGQIKDNRPGTPSPRSPFKGVLRGKLQQQTERVLSGGQPIMIISPTTETSLFSASPRIRAHFVQFECIRYPPLYVLLLQELTASGHISQKKHPTWRTSPYSSPQDVDLLNRGSLRACSCGRVVKLVECVELCVYHQRRRARLFIPRAGARSRSARRHRRRVTIRCKVMESNSASDQTDDLAGARV
ncbi:unnamed protein product [Leuciscus chuanchicus]